MLAQLFPGFLAAWGSDTWNGAIRVIVHWFVSANRGDGGVDGGIALAQTALERLAWTFLVRDRQALTKREFNDLRAHDRLRRLLHEQGIPATIPTACDALASLPRSSAQWDGPAAVTRIRNNIVHPEQQGAAEYRSLPARVAAYRLALQYIELSLLHISNYQGSFSDRMRHRYGGDVDVVPWAVHASPNTDG
jgi:hypothetical protein